MTVLASSLTVSGRRATERQTGLLFCGFGTTQYALSVDSESGSIPPECCVGWDILIFLFQGIRRCLADPVRHMLGMRNPLLLVLS